MSKLNILCILSGLIEDRSLHLIRPSVNFGKLARQALIATFISLSLIHKLGNLRHDSIDLSTTLGLHASLLESTKVGKLGVLFHDDVITLFDFSLQTGNLGLHFVGRHFHALIVIVIIVIIIFNGFLFKLMILFSIIRLGKLLNGIGFHNHNFNLSDFIGNSQAFLG